MKNFKSGEFILQHISTGPFQSFSHDHVFVRKSRPDRYVSCVSFLFDQGASGIAGYNREQIISFIWPLIL